MAKGIKQRERGRKQLLSLCLVKGRAGFTNTHPPTHTLDRLLTVSSLSGFVDWYSRSQPGLWWLAKAYTVRLANSS